MPLYEFKCKSHGVFEEFFFSSNGDIVGKCPTCGKRGNRVFSVFSHTVDFRDGWDAGLGEYVDTKKDRETHMREKGLVRQKN